MLLQSAVDQRVPFHLSSAQFADDEDRFGSGLCCRCCSRREIYKQNDTPELADSALQRETMSCSPKTGNHLGGGGGGCRCVLGEERGRRWEWGGGGIEWWFWGGICVGEQACECMDRFTITVDKSHTVAQLVRALLANSKVSGSGPGGVTMIFFFIWLASVEFRREKSSTKHVASNFPIIQVIIILIH